MIHINGTKTTQDGTWLYFSEDRKEKRRLFDNENDANDFADALREREVVMI